MTATTQSRPPGTKGPLADRVALVTGGTRGIGAAISHRLAADGAHVAAGYWRQHEAAEKFMLGINDEYPGTYTVHNGNIGEPEDCRRVVREVIEQHGRLDILVNNAGITRDQILLRMKEEDWERVLSVNLKGTFHLTKAGLRPFLKQKAGKVVNIASVTGQMGNAGQANYAASKAGVIGFTKSVAREYASRNIQVNAVAPGFIETAMSQAIPQKEREFLIKQIPAERLGNPEDVAEAVLFLSSPAADYITGQVLNVNGGMYM